MLEIGVMDPVRTKNRSTKTIRIRTGIRNQTLDRHVCLRNEAEARLVQGRAMSDKVRRIFGITLATQLAASPDQVRVSPCSEPSCVVFKTNHSQREA